MAVRYDTRRKNWYFVIDLPRGGEGKRRQMFRRGFKTEKLAGRAEELARTQFGHTDLSADGTVAAELRGWMRERELEVAPTTLANYRNAILKYVIAHRILMGPAGDLGPVDSIDGRMGLVGADEIVAAVDEAEERVKNSPETYPLFRPFSPTST